MKLPISLLLVAALGSAASAGPATKPAYAKSDENKNKLKEGNQNTKRDLLEGNFGERTTALPSSYSSTEATPGIEYTDAEKVKQVLSDQSPAHQTFGARLPQISKISDVLTGHGPPFEVAVANHLHAPISVYQPRLSSPTSFEVPSPAASQAYPNPKSFHIHKISENDQKPQHISSKESEQPPPMINLPVFALKQPLRYEPRPFAPKFTHHQSILLQDVIRKPQLRQPVPKIFPISDGLGLYRNPEQILPSQYLQHKGIYKSISNPGFDYIDLSSLENDYINQEPSKELNTGPTEKPKHEIAIPLPKQDYLAHPYGAISFTRFSQKLPPTMQQGIVKHSQPEKRLSIQQQPEQQTSEELPFALKPNSQQQKLTSVKQNLNYPFGYKQYVRELQNLHPHQVEMLFRLPPETQPISEQITLQQPIRQQPRIIINPLQQQLLLANPGFPLPQTIQFQRVPVFKTLPQSHSSAEALFQPKKITSPVQERLLRFKLSLLPRPFGYPNLKPSQDSTHIDQPLAPAPPQHHLTPLPPLKPNYSPSVQPLDLLVPSSTSAASLPTTLKSLSTISPTTQSVPDQLISSTTITPIINDQREVEQSIQSEIQVHSQTSSPLNLEVTNQSQTSIGSQSVQSTTYQPISTTQLQHVQQTTQRPQYHSTINPQSINKSPRHEVVIQQQELRELVFEPSTQLSSTPHHHQLQYQKNPHYEQEQAIHQLQSEYQQDELEQINPQNYHDEINQFLHSSQPFIFPQEQYVTQQLEPQQRQNHHEKDQSQHEFELHEAHQQHHVSNQLQSQHHEKNTQQIQTNHEQYQNQLLESTSPIKPSQEPDKQTEPQLDSQNQPNLQDQPSPQDHLNHQDQPTPQDLSSSPQDQISPQDQPSLQNQPNYQPHPQYQAVLQSFADKVQEHTEKLPAPSDQPLYSGEYVSPILSQVAPGPAEIYVQPRQLFVQPQFGSPVGPPFSEVKYFGKYAQDIFGGQH